VRPWHSLQSNFRFYFKACHGLGLTPRKPWHTQKYSLIHIFTFQNG
jgi:hypothetical protein